MKKPFDVAAAARTLKERDEAENAALLKRRTEAQILGKEIARLLGKADPTLEKVVGFGSTYETWRNFRFDSDVDLGIIGGAADKLEKLLPLGGIEVTLIELDLQPEQFRKLALKNGVVLYAK